MADRATAPAFPRPATGHYDPDQPSRGFQVHEPSTAGLTTRAYFAAHAPSVPDWFIPRMPPQPADPRTVSGSSEDFVAALQRRQAWAEMYDRERIFQWPWVYADQVTQRGEILLDAGSSQSA